MYFHNYFSDFYLFSFQTPFKWLTFSKLWVFEKFCFLLCSTCLKFSNMFPTCFLVVCWIFYLVNAMLNLTIFFLCFHIFHYNVLYCNWCNIASNLRDSYWKILTFFFYIIFICPEPVGPLVHFGSSISCCWFFSKVWQWLVFPWGLGIYTY